MNKSFFASVSLFLVLGSALVTACGGGDSNGAASCAGPEGQTLSNECKSCVQSSCGSQYSAFCSANCSSSNSSSACQKATQDVSSCVFDHCISQCSDDNSGDNSGGGSGSVDMPNGNAGTGNSQTPGTPTTSHCVELAACCESLPQQAKDPCLTAAGYDNDGPCQNLLNSYHSAGVCGGEDGAGGAGSGSTGGDTFACYQADSGTCAQLKISGGLRAMYEKACTDDGSVPSETCPTKDLIGCCAFTTAAESCLYMTDGNATIDESTCTQAGGKWSATP